MRNFAAPFLAQAARKSGAKPYLVLEVDWGDPTGTRYYLDRASDAFATNDGNRVPAGGLGDALVAAWPTVSISLKEGQVGATDQCSVTLDDRSGEITAILNGSVQQRRLVTLWRMFDDPTVTWSDHKARMFTGCLRPFDWTAKDNQITLNLGDLGPQLAKDVSCVAGASVFNSAPVASQDKNIPLCWGYSQRVEALLIAAPWETKITQSFNSSNPLTVNIADHPDDMPGVAAETQYDATLGTDRVKVTFHQSADPANTPSTATISVPAPPLVATAGVEVLDDGSVQPNTEPQYITFLWYYYATWPVKRQGDLANVVQSGWPITISDKLGGVHQSSVYTLTLIPADTSVWTMDVYKLIVPNATISIDNSTNPPTMTTLWDIRNNLSSVAFFPPANDVNPWPTGTVLRSADTTHIYAVNALPSKAVQRVEGFGAISDASGDGRKDFVILGQSTSIVNAGSSTATIVTDDFQVNLNDGSWVGTLGRNLTTITFNKAPRDKYPNLDDNRLWITLQGVDDAGNSSGNVITNPATVILQYLENPHLMNVDPGSIDEASFTAAATALANYSVGFPQLETKPGLQLLQEIAAQCNSILLFDQGQARLVVLSDSPDTIRLSFDSNPQASDNLLQGALSTAESSADDVINEIIVKWTPFWDDKTGNKPRDVRNYKTGSIEAFGRISRELPMYLYWRRTDVETQRDWWLDHLSTIWRTVKFSAFLDALILQPGDWVSVWWIDGAGRDLFGGAKSMQVTKVSDRGPDGLVDIEARYAKFTYAN